MSPFDAGNGPAYRRWRAYKQAGYPASLEHITVTIDNPAALTPQ